MKYVLDPSKMRDGINRIRTASLVYEKCRTNDNEFAIFTMDRNDRVINGKTYFSLHKLYIDIGDPTEYDFAMKVFGSWQIWERFCGNNMFSKDINNWRFELEVKIRSTAVKQIVKNSKEGIKGQSAAKFLSDGGWDNTPLSKKKKARNEDIKDRIHDELSEIEESIGITPELKH